ncbi:MAG: hypothetical protein PHE06_00310 [Lachnospiraceae bacterium]|nr:hypothetical protein [Lachnospiraceae bacterium]
MPFKEIPYLDASAPYKYPEVILLLPCRFAKQICVTEINMIK